MKKFKPNFAIIIGVTLANYFLGLYAIWNEPFEWKQGTEILGFVEASGFVGLAIFLGVVLASIVVLIGRMLGKMAGLKLPADFTSLALWGALNLTGVYVIWIGPNHI